MSKSIEIKFRPLEEYQDENIYNCVDCGCGCQNYFDADEIE